MTLELEQNDNIVDIPISSEELSLINVGCKKYNNNENINLLSPTEIRNYKIYYVLLNIMILASILPNIVHSSENNNIDINNIIYDKGQSVTTNSICICLYNLYNYYIVMTKGNICYHFLNEFLYVCFNFSYYTYIIYLFQLDNKEIRLIMNSLCIFFLTIQIISNIKGRNLKSYSIKFLPLISPFLILLSLYLIFN